VSADNSDAQSFADGRANIRETIKWMVAAFAGLAAVLVGTAPLSNIGELTGTALILASACAIVGFACVLAAIDIALKILVTPLIFLSDISADKSLSDVIDSHRDDVLPPGIATIAKFVENRLKTQNKLLALLSAKAEPHETEEARKAKQAEIARVQASFDATNAVSARLLGLAHYEQLRRDFDKSRKSLFLVAVAAFVALSTFGWITTHARPDAPAKPLHVILDQP
jgi:hypothetical protein